MGQSVSHSVTQWVTRSPIELSGDSYKLEKEITDSFLNSETIQNHNSQLIEINVYVGKNAHVTLDDVGRGNVKIERELWKENLQLTRD